MVSITEAKLKHEKKYDDKGATVKRNKTLLKHIYEKMVESRKNFLLRMIFGAFLISHLLFTIYVGPFAILGTSVLIQIKCFAEINSIANAFYPVNEPPFFKLLSWHFLVVANYFFYGETLLDYLSVYIKHVEILQLMISYHRFLSFCLYMFGMVLFVVSLRKKYGKQQFSLFAFTHVAVLLLAFQSSMMVQITFQGIIWLVIPVTSVVCNDIMAYVFGKLLGRTPLIDVSPKKTWEGFIGAAISTIIYGCVSSYFLCQYPYFTCPSQYVEKLGKMTIDTNCTTPETFQIQEFAIEFNLKSFSLEATIMTFPFIFHSIIISLFASIIAPFGGFFASGFKRAFRIKDFSEAIPGHGGVLDRFDCQFLMATFVNVYISSFINKTTPEKIFSKILNLEPDQQVQFYYLLKDYFKDGIIL